MRNCLLCEQKFTPPVSFAQIFSFKQFRENKLCFHCLAQFEPLRGNHCLLCAKFLPQGVICADCQRWQKIYQGKTLRHHALYHYNQAFHDLMVAYKRYGDYVLREVLQELCYEYLQQTDFACYVPIPTSPEHQKKRQFDTIRAIYEDLVPLTLLLQKKSGSSAQGEKNKRQRLETPQSFWIDQTIKVSEKIVSGKILILDDIYTTGRTLYHARDCLQAAFPHAQIESFSICR